MINKFDPRIYSESWSTVQSWTFLIFPFFPNVKRENNKSCLVTRKKYQFWYFILFLFYFFWKSIFYFILKYFKIYFYFIFFSNSDSNTKFKKRNNQYEYTSRAWCKNKSNFTCITFSISSINLIFSSRYLMIIMTSTSIMVFTLFYYLIE